VGHKADHVEKRKPIKGQSRPKMTDKRGGIKGEHQQENREKAPLFRETANRTRVAGKRL